MSAVDVSVCAMYDGEARGSRLLDRSRLSPQDQRLVLVGSRYSLTFEDISESLVMRLPDFKPPPPVMRKDGQIINPRLRTRAAGRGQASARSARSWSRRRARIDNDQGDEAASEEHGGGGDQLHDADNDHNDAEDDAGDEEPGEDLDDLIQVLAVTARRLASVKLGRKCSGSKVPPSELKKKRQRARLAGRLVTGGVIPNARCLEQVLPLLHRLHRLRSPATSVPANAKKGGKGGKADKPHQAFAVMHSDLGKYEIRSGYGTAVAESQEGSYQVNVVFAAVLSRIALALSAMVLDTACQRTCCDRRWLRERRDLLDVCGLETKKVDCRDWFEFGKGDPLPVDHRACVPAVLDNGSSFFFGAGVLDAGIPLLASNPLLKALGVILDPPRMVAYFEQLSAEVPVVNLNGHLAVNVAAFSADTVASLKQYMDS